MKFILSLQILQIDKMSDTTKKESGSYDQEAKSGSSSPKITVSVGGSMESGGLKLSGEAGVSSSSSGSDASVSVGIGYSWKL